MKLLFIDGPSFGKADMIAAFEKQGLDIVLFWNDKLYERTNELLENEVVDIMKNEDVSLVFSFNYYPLMSKCCQRAGVKYISHVYDSPQNALFSTTILNSCNYVFIFDKAMYLELKNGGINTVYYLPMMAAADRLDNLVVPESAVDTISSDVSFVGSMYNEKHNLYDRMYENLDTYARGYLDGIIEAQLKVWGISFADKLLTDKIIECMYKSMPYQNQEDGAETLRYIYSNYFIARKVTSIERQRLLKVVSERFQLKLYTHNKPEDMPEAQFMGPIDWEESMPAVFKHSRINLNITLRSIQTGIPLRAFDIMGAGGFLLSNYQEDFLDYFIPGEDFVYFEDENDMLLKIEYYLNHDKERKEIAFNGYEKVKKSHTYDARAEYMLKVVRNEI